MAALVLGVLYKFQLDSLELKWIKNSNWKSRDSAAPNHNFMGGTCISLDHPGYIINIWGISKIGAHSLVFDYSSTTIGIFCLCAKYFWRRYQFLLWLQWNSNKAQLLSESDEYLWAVTINETIECTATKKIRYISVWSLRIWLTVAHLCHCAIGHNGGTSMHKRVSLPTMYDQNDISINWWEGGGIRCVYPKPRSYRTVS